MHRVVIRRAATTDIGGIARYTKKRWGAVQARRYLDALRFDIESLASFPYRSHIVSENDANTRKMPSGHHLVFYRATEDMVEVVRVLHERMDVPDDLERS